MTSRARITILPLALLVAAGSFAPMQSAGAQSSTAFSQLKGTWRGTGRVAYNDGSKQRISCRGYYKLRSKATLGLAIRCAAQDNKIELRASLSERRGRLSGTWEERTFNATGDISGSSRPGQLRMAISGSMIGSMQISYSSKKQSVQISTSTTALKSINISMRR